MLPNERIARVRYDRLLGDLKSTYAQLQFGPAIDSLPLWTRQQFDKAVKEDGRQLIIIDHIVHDMADFYDEHPGGDEILRNKIGKDATIAFNGGVQRHSKAARNLLEFMRVARMDPVQTKDIPVVVDE